MPVPVERTQRGRIQGHPRSYRFGALDATSGTLPGQLSSRQSAGSAVLFGARVGRPRCHRDHVQQQSRRARRTWRRPPTRPGSDRRPRVAVRRFARWTACAADPVWAPLQDGRPPVLVGQPPRAVLQAGRTARVQRERQATRPIEFGDDLRVASVIGSVAQMCWFTALHVLTRVAENWSAHPHVPRAGRPGAMPVAVNPSASAACSSQPPEWMRAAPARCRPRPGGVSATPRSRPAADCRTTMRGARALTGAPGAAAAVACGLCLWLFT